MKAFTFCYERFGCWWFYIDTQFFNDSIAKKGSIDTLQFIARKRSLSFPHYLISLVIANTQNTHCCVINVSYLEYNHDKIISVLYNLLNVCYLEFRNKTRKTALCNRYQCSDIKYNRSCFKYGLCNDDRGWHIDQDKQMISKLS